MLGIQKVIHLNNGCRVETVLGNANELMISVAGDSEKAFIVCKCISRYIRDIEGHKQHSYKANGSYSFIIKFDSIYNLDRILIELEELLKIL